MTPVRVRDHVAVRGLALGLGLIPPRTMHSPADAGVISACARGALTVVEIGVYEGSSALVLCAALAPDAELHLIDPFGERPDALPAGWAASAWATRRVLARAGGPRKVWHRALASEVAEDWGEPLDLVFIDGDHSEAGCDLDWRCWHGHVRRGGHVVFHDARAGRPNGRGLPGPTAVVDRRFRGAGPDPDWEIVAEADRTVAVRRNSGQPA